MRSSSARIRAKAICVVESQGYRCACCQINITTDTYFDDYRFATLGKLNRAGQYNYRNVVAMCRRCHGYSANEDSIMAFYEKLCSGAFVCPIDRGIDPADESVVDAILVELEKLGITHLPRAMVAKNFGRAPVNKIPTIVKKVALQDKFLNPEARAASKRRKNNRTAIWMSSGQKRRFSEAQNHRCCYCHCELDLESLKTYSSRYPTWEHVQDMQHGGVTKKRNLVIACSTCNNLRSIMQFDAYAFYDWAQDNLEVIESRARHIDHRHRTKERTRMTPFNGIRDEPLVNHG